MKIINLIEYIEQRPLMYLREKSLIQLDAFLGGYQVAASEYGIKDDFLKIDLVCFLNRKYNLKEDSWYNLVNLIAIKENKNSFDVFFKLINDFKKEIEKL